MALTLSQKQVLADCAKQERVAVNRYDRRVINNLVRLGLVMEKAGFLYLLKKDTKAETAPTAPKTKKTSKPARSATSQVSNCLCGCGGEVGARRRFVQGHDMKLRSLVTATLRAGDKLHLTEAQMEFVKNSHWYAALISNGGAA